LLLGSLNAAARPVLAGRFIISGIGWGVCMVESHLSIAREDSTSSQNHTVGGLDRSIPAQRLSAVP